MILKKAEISSSQEIGGFTNMNENQHTGLSVSFRIDDGIIEHNNRSFIAKNVVRERIPDNITYGNTAQLTPHCHKKSDIL